MAKKKFYKQGATTAEVEASLLSFNLFDNAIDAVAIPDADASPPARPAAAPKAVRLSWYPVERIDTNAAWDAFLRHI